MIAGIALIVCLIGLAWLFHSQRQRHRARRDDLKRRLASSESWYESASARSHDELADDAEPSEPHEQR